jgi:hypothetical protein
VSLSTVALIRTGVLNEYEGVCPGSWPRFYLQRQYFSEWAMLGSNQRPLPCEGRSITSWLFAGVQKYLQMSMSFLTSCRPCSPLFVWVGVLLV